MWPTVLQRYQNVDNKSNTDKQCDRIKYTYHVFQTDLIFFFAFIQQARAHKHTQPTISFSFLFFFFLVLLFFRWRHRRSIKISR